MADAIALANETPGSDRCTKLLAGQDGLRGSPDRLSEWIAVRRVVSQKALDRLDELGGCSRFLEEVATLDRIERHRCMEQLLDLRPLRGDRETWLSEILSAIGIGNVRHGANRRL